MKMPYSYPRDLGFRRDFAQEASPWPALRRELPSLAPADYFPDLQPA